MDYLGLDAAALEPQLRQCSFAHAVSGHGEWAGNAMDQRRARNRGRVLIVVSAS
jgi:hypothetical protein